MNNNHSTKWGGFFMLKTHVMKMNTENTPRSSAGAGKPFMSATNLKK